MQNFGGQTRCVMERCANGELSIQPPPNRVFKRRQRVLKRGEGGGGGGVEGFEAF